MGQEAFGSSVGDRHEDHCYLAPSRAGTQVGAMLKLLNDKGEVLLGVAGGGPGEVPQGGAPAPSTSDQKPSDEKKE